MTLPQPIFIDTDPAAILAALKADYESRTGKVLEPGQAEQILIDLFAYRETVLRGAVQEAGKQNLLAFASAPILDYLGELLGVVRLAAASAVIDVDFTLTPGSGALVIPQGLRIRSTDGKAVFVLIAPVSVTAGAVSASGKFIAQLPGVFANGYAIGTVSVIMDPQPYLTAVTNTTASNGGSDQESDDKLRERIRLAPSSFSTAGPSGAYKYHARSAHPSIIDVGVIMPVAGTVNVYPLSTLGMPTPLSVLDAVDAALSAETVRPLSDTVNVISPTPLAYAIDVEIVIYEDADQPAVEAALQAALQAYADQRSQQLGKDVMLSQIIRVANDLEDIYDIVVISPVADVVTGAESVVTECTGITVTTTGVH